jgi:hypothetical protein
MNFSSLRDRSCSFAVLEKSRSFIFGTLENSAGAVRGRTRMFLCARRGRYSVAKLMAEHGDAKPTDLLLKRSPMPEGGLSQRP